ncbi:hypothetical protein NY536_18630, partial [Enterobacter hormaechei]|nr:hypothetical protein [Enterobacter hormaechei]
KKYTPCFLSPTTFPAFLFCLSGNNCYIYAMALAFIRPFIKRIVIGINLLVIFIYLLGCLSPWVNPVYFTPISFIAITMP